LEKPRKSVRRKGHAATIADVASLAKVSPMTVSRVINGQGKVRDATRERVMRAVRELDYTPNLAASSLAAAQHTRIALIYTNPSGAYLRELLVGLLRVASRTAIQLVIDYWDDTSAESERKAARPTSFVCGAWSSHGVSAASCVAIACASARSR
jgi:LacI family transcriptional regulator